MNAALAASISEAPVVVESPYFSSTATPTTSSSVVPDALESKASPKPKKRRRVVDPDFRAARARTPAAERTSRPRKKPRLDTPLASASSEPCSRCIASNFASASAGGSGAGHGAGAGSGTGSGAGSGTGSGAGSGASSGAGRGDSFDGHDGVMFFPGHDLTLCAACSCAVLLSKSEAKLRFGLTESDLRPLLAARLPNPLRRSFAPMLLYARADVEQVTRRKYGSLDAVWTEEKWRLWRNDSRRKHNERRNARMRQQTRQQPQTQQRTVAATRAEAAAAAVATAATAAAEAAADESKPPSAAGAADPEETETDESAASGQSDEGDEIELDQGASESADGVDDD